MTAFGSAFEFLSGWFADHTLWAVLIVGVVVGTFAITLRLDRDT